MVDHSAELRGPVVEGAEGSEKSIHFLNREISWLRFNLRVLEEAEHKRHPLLERVKFLTIFATNLDEFFMIRLSGLRRQVAAGTGGTTPDGMTPSEQILAINRELNVQFERYDRCWKQDVLPSLREAGIRILHYVDLTARERDAIQQYFQRDIFPVLTPLAFDPTHPFPHISSLSFNLAVLVKTLSVAIVSHRSKCRMSFKTGSHSYRQRCRPPAAGTGWDGKNSTICVARGSHRS